MRSMTLPVQLVRLWPLQELGWSAGLPFFSFGMMVAFFERRGRTSLWLDNGQVAGMKQSLVARRRETLQHLIGNLVRAR